MPGLVRFLLTGNDLNRVIPASIQVEDVLPGGPAGGPLPGSLRLKFRLSDPGPAQIRPLLPGLLRFLPDPAAPGIVPDPDAGPFAEADFPNWRTKGRIQISMDGRAANELAGLAPELPAKPNRVWYGPVRIPPGFLFNTLSTGLDKGVITTAAGATIRTNNPNWSRYAIAAFLNGHYAPVLKTANDPAQDDRIRFVMPTVVVPAGGEVELIITTARSQRPQDSPDSEFENVGPALPREDPRHPRNGPVPAREVYRRLRPHMLPDPAAVPIMDAILADWPDAPLFRRIVFSRTWNAIPNCSVFFPRQRVRILEGANVLLDQPLPAHGVVYVRLEPAPAGQPQPAAPTVQVSLVGNMKWTPGGANSWRQPGLTNAIAVDLEAVANPHVSVRLPMSDALYSDTSRPTPGGDSCTYLSLRRTVRALVDNRIAGGRLNFGVRPTTAATREIIRSALAGTPGTVGSVAANAPNPNGDPDPLALTLEPLLLSFFPAPAQQQPIPGPPEKIYDEGKVVYRLWQSWVNAFQQNETQRNFDPAHIGRGAPGAMVEAGLAAYHVDPVRNPGEADAAYFDRIVGAMLAGLQRGALLQFWNEDSDFENLKNRAVPGGTRDGLNSYGHSPLFVRYILDGLGNVTALRIVDQHGKANQDGESELTVAGVEGSRRLVWEGNQQAIWIAANWTE